LIRLTIPSIEEDDLQAVQETLQTGYLVQSTRVAGFEQAIQDYVGRNYAVAVSNCTAALHLALLSLGVQSDDLVLVTAYSWPATANVIELCGAHPVFVDIQPDTFNLDPNRLENALKPLMGLSTTAKRVKAILPVHTFGQLADMPNILRVADQYGRIPVLEDAACALGASLHGIQAGAWGVMGCFSFHPRKAITTGEGGVVITADSVHTNRIRALRNHGQDPEAKTPDFIMPGFNYRMTEFQAALGLTQVSKLDRIITARRQKAANYDRLLANTSIAVPAVPSDSQPVYQSYVVLLPEKSAKARTEIIANLKDHGIETTIGTYHMPMTTYFRTRYGYRPGDFPVADAVFERSLTLPLHEKLTPQEQEQVVIALVNCVEGIR
jgi:perosamine synthetase